MSTKQNSPQENEWQYAIDVEGHYERGNLVRYRELEIRGGPLRDPVYAIEPIPNPFDRMMPMEKSRFDEDFERFNIREQMQRIRNLGYEDVSPEARKIRENVAKLIINCIDGDELKKVLDAIPPWSPIFNKRSPEFKKAVDDEYWRQHEVVAVDKPSPWKSAKPRPIAIQYRKANHPGHNEGEIIETRETDMDARAWRTIHYVIKDVEGELYPINIQLFNKLYEKLD